MAKRKLYVSPKTVARKDTKMLMAELKDLFLRDDTEMAGRGLFHQAMASLPFAGGHIDKDTALVVKCKDLILELEERIGEID